MSAEVFVDTNVFESREIVTLFSFVSTRLPRGYFFTDEDSQWLETCNKFLVSAPTNETVVAAVKNALKVHPEGHIDPFELLIDAGICNTKCEPVSN